MPDSTLLASQPIYDRQGSVYAVELLYRNDLSQSALEVGETVATSELLFNLCTGITEQTDHYHRPAFINVSSEFLLSNSFLPIDPDRVVVELVERLEPTPELVSAVKAWYRKGFRFALDDFEFVPSWQPLLPFASVIKVDVLNQDHDAIARKVSRLQEVSCLWLAERVEDQDVRDRYLDLGFDLFQGYFYARPKIIVGKKLSPSALQLARLLSALFVGEPDTNKLVDIVSSDPGLTVSLMKIVNSPIYRTGSRITSIKEVIVRLGLVNLRRWIALIGALEAASPEAARIVLVRAQYCRMLALRSKHESLDPEEAFLVGLLSGVDILLNVEKTSFYAQLNLANSLLEAIEHTKGLLGKILRVALRIESAVLMKSDLKSLDARLLKMYRQANDSVQTLLNEV